MSSESRGGSHSKGEWGFTPCSSESHSMWGLLRAEFGPQSFHRRKGFPAISNYPAMRWCKFRLSDASTELGDFPDPGIFSKSLLNLANVLVDEERSFSCCTLPLPLFS